MVTGPQVCRLTAVEVAVAPYAWPAAIECRADIDAHFAAARRVRPHLWNGRVMLSRDVAVNGGRLTGQAFETDFASFLWWRDNGFPDAALRNVFAMAAVRGSDGGFLLGRMGGHTANAGRVYFPAGTPDPDDVRDGRIDFAASVARELAEETGLDATTLRAAEGWTAVIDPPRIALIRVFQGGASSGNLVARVRAHIAVDPGAELADAIAVGQLADLPDAAPPFVRAFLTDAFAV